MKKKCTTCKVELELTEFYKEVRGKYGVRSKCKSCQAVYGQVNKKSLSKNSKAYQRRQRAKQPAGVYKITSTVTGRYYLGATSGFKQRMSAHRSELSLDKHPTAILQEEYNLYGPDSFSYELVSECRVEDLKSIEEWLLGDLVDNDPNCLNVYRFSNFKYERLLSYKATK